MTTSPQAGTAAANQYGVFQVRYPSEKQQRFVATLAARKAVTDAGLVASVAEVAAGTLNLKATSRLIDALMQLPDAVTPAAFRKPGNPASAKQVELMTKLGVEREGGAIYLQTAANVLGVADITDFTTREASTAIDGLFALPKARATKTGSDKIESGMYRGTDGTIYRVYLGQQSGRQLVKRLDDTGRTWVDGRGETRKEFEYTYLGQADYKLPADATALPLEEAKAWGSMTSSCCVCAARLDDPESVDAGIGPVCGRKYGVR